MLRTRERMQAALAAKQHAGFVIPTAGRRRLLQAPIWFAPRTAAKFGSTSYAWRTTDGLNHGIYTTNVQPQRIIDGSDGSFNPGGLLTWMDLDLMMFLSAVFLSRKVDYIDTDQRSIFAAIGYAALDDPPYQELRSAIARLVGTQIWTIDEAVDGRVDGPILLPRLLETNEELKQAWRQEGRRNKLVVAVGHGWLSEVASENQVVDLNSYLYLVRCIRSADAISRRRGEDEEDSVRPPDIARSILLFLDSMRQIDGTRHATTVKTGWLLERFGDRHKSIPATYADADLKKRADAIAKSREQAEIHQKTEAQRTFGEMPSPEFKYLDPMHPNSRIRRSLDAMVRLGILKPYSVDGDRLSVAWADPSHLPRLRVDARNVNWSDLAPVAEEGEQRSLVQVDKLTGSLRIPHQDAPPGVAITASADVLPPVQVAAPAEEPEDQAGVQRRAEAAFLFKLVPIHRSTLQAARTRGWTDTPHLRHLLIVTLWKKAQNHVRDAAAFAAKQLAELEPSAYERPALTSGGLPMDEIVAWWAGPESPKRLYQDRWDRSLALAGRQRQRTVATAAEPEAPPLPTVRKPPAPTEAVAAVGREDDDEVTQIAIELREHQEVARQLGHSVDTVPQRVRSAERIAADEKLYRQWRLAIERRTT